MAGSEGARPPLQTSVSRSSSFSRAASFRFTPRPSPTSSPSGGAQPVPDAHGTTTPPVASIDQPLIVNQGVPTPTATTAGGLSRHTSFSSRTQSRPGSTVTSPISSPREEHKGTWPYSTANSSTSSIQSQVQSHSHPNAALSRTHSASKHDRSHTVTPTQHHKEGIENKDPSFGMSAGSTIAKPDYSEAKIVVAMVGLPARGKSYLSNKLQRYLLWLEYSVKVFNVGQYRRAKYRELAKVSGKKADQSSNFFDANNPEASKAREAMAAECLEDLIKWLKQGGNVGIHDATNSTRARRKALADRIAREPGLKLIFIESLCTDPAVIAANIKVKVASGDPDYDGQEPEQAERDFKERIKHYEQSYEPLDEKLDGEMTFCKMVNVGKQVTVNRIDGYLQSRIAFYLMNLHLTPRSIYFTRHGESQYNVDGQIGGDAALSAQGEKYMQALPELIKQKLGDTPLTVWTSTLRRTIQTASLLPYEKLTWKSLDELDAGVCDGMTYEEIEQYYPEDYNARDDDKFNYRYRGGESYRDVVIRLEPVILELERQENILVVCHQAVLRCLYAYFHNLPQEDLPYIKIPLHTVIKLTPKAYGCDEERFTLPIEAVDTTRPRPLGRVDLIRKERDLGTLSPSTSRPPSRGKPFSMTDS
ncbi:fructose-2,6-bisphosphatase [Sporobolomyces koalae]|uniref:fructose-2,6-bisphosphatase n=1 Tax=Sporobolomyces koalae TaxID=500713 RepID=UPI003174EE4D